MYIMTGSIKGLVVITKVWNAYPTPRELEVYKACNPRYTWSKVEY